MAAWDRQEGESVLAYSHFCVYRDQGPERTLEKTGKILGKAPAYMEELSAKRQWVDRADKWDAHVRNLHDRAYLTEVGKRAKQRAAAHMKLLAKAVAALDAYDPKKATIGQIAAAMKVASEGVRLEEGLETSRVLMEVQDARTILSRFPAEIRAGLCRLLEGDADAGADTGDNRAVPLGLDGED